MLPILTVAFILSGAAGLIYESIWSRYLSLFVGHSAYAQIIVLVMFLGGMSAGALAAGERSERLQRPLLWYAGVELLVGLIGFVFHGAFVATTRIAYEHWFPALAGGFWLTVVKWSLASVLILPQSVLLGATFPLMSAGAIRLRRAASGHTLGLLYFANSIGAAVGVLIAGFVLIAWVGLPGTLSIAAILNCVVAALVVSAVAFQRTWEDSIAPPADAGYHPPAPSEAVSRARLSLLWRLLLAVSFGTAVASFIYEISWIRMLSLVLGSATHSFELMLSAFILGLAAGAFWVRRRADRFENPVRVLGVVQWIMGSMAIATLPLYVASFHWTSALLDTFKGSDGGYHGFVLARYGICLLVMVPATFCAGITLPLITKMLLDAGAGERSIGLVYAVNTLGSIVGVVLAGLVLMPVLGLKALLVSGALVDVALGVVLLAMERRLAPAAAPGAPTRLRHTWVARAETPSLVPYAVVSVAALVAGAALVPFNRSLLASGVFRHGIVPAPNAFTFLFYKDGRTATVSVRRDADDTSSILTIATNGKPDASVDAVWRHPMSPAQKPVALEGDLSTQVLLPVITLAHAPMAREAAVIGEGSGMSSHFLLGSPNLRRLTTIEIEPEMINASKAFRPANRRVFDDPRSRFVVDDAKSVFAASSRKYDLILSEPSNPWVSGVSGLFTQEFYRHVRNHLADGGVFGQWLHLYEINDDLVMSVLAALDSAFPTYDVFLTSNADLLVVASKEPVLRPPDWSVLRFPGIAEDLARTVPLTPGYLEAMRLVDRPAIHPYLTVHVARNSDYYPILDLGTERTRFLHSDADGVTSLGDGLFDMVAALAGRRRGPVERAADPAPEIDRAAAMSLGARLAALRNVGSPTPDSLAGDDETRSALRKVRTWDRELAAGAVPSDWRMWVRDAVAVDSLLYTGTAGVVDESFYAPMRAFLVRTKAPPEVESAVSFLHGLAAWDWAQVSRASDVLIAAQRRDEAWMPVGLLREGGAVAKLKLGDPAAAEAVFKALASRGDATYRERVLSAVVLEAKKR